MSTAPLTTDPDCLFCGIVAGRIPSRQVYADDQAVAFLDLNAWHRGHTLVIPREHTPDLITGPAMMERIGPAIDATARLLRDRLAPDAINLLSSAGETAGQTVFHLHVHVVPRYTHTPGLGALIHPQHVDAAELDAVHAEIIGALTPAADGGQA